MIKKLELADPKSCLNKAYMDETLFVLLARDKAAPATIKAWIEERIRLGLNKADDAQIQAAWVCRERMMTEPQTWTN